ncbi:cell wall-binding protein [Clostridium diolis]|uniref:N-acetylmuramoyl-L-alanine amidase family protein n=1 Tax=Clostridium diolis TaxID=223919 RepID=UPI000B3FE62E|nr:N-acetylmuramoyl-L-alanine amidase family protein [Clostridium diolis]OVE69800.1 cell wall-binding protein [Clostridium diolis]
MKSLKLRKLVACAVAALTIATISPIGASAEWKQDSNGWWNTEGSSYSTGWRAINGSWYYFDSIGYMKTGWVNDGGTWYYLQSSGEMRTGWVNDGGTWYYLQSSGAMKTGWINDNGVWYFASTSGAMQTGVVQIDGKVYYLASNGAMQVGNVTIDGVVYTFAATGEATGTKIPTPTLGFTSSGVTVDLNKPADTNTDTDTDKDDETESGSHHSSGGGSSGVKDAQQDAINKVYGNQTKVNLQVSKPDADGAVTLKPSVTFNPGEESTQVINGVTYTVQKDINVSLNNGTDVGLSGNYSDGYKIAEGQSGTVTTVISLVGSDGTIRYVSATPVYFRN